MTTIMCKVTSGYLLSVLLRRLIIKCTDCLKVVPGALGVISSADDDSSDSLSEPVAKKRDIVVKRYQSVQGKKTKPEFTNHFKDDRFSKKVSYLPLRKNTGCKGLLPEYKK